MQTREAPHIRPRAVAKEIRDLFAEGRQPSFTEIDIGSWHRALDILIDQDDYPAARFGASLLLARHPDLKAMKALCRLIDIAPRASEGTPIGKERTKAIEVVRREGADTVLFVFTGNFGSLGMPVGLAHRWLGRLDATIVYLHDFSHRSYYAGLRSVAANREDTAAELRKLAASLGARRIACYGYSLAGYAAILYGIELGADAVVSMDGPTGVAVARGPVGSLVAAAKVPTTLDAALAGVPRPPRILIVSGDERRGEFVQADAVAHLPPVTVRLVERHGGPAAPELICRGQFDRVLDWLMATSPEAPADIGEFKYRPWQETVD